MSDAIASEYKARIAQAAVRLATGRAGEPTLVVLTVKGRRWLTTLRWGLIPGWAETAAGPGQLHARAETIAQRASFRHALSLRRCILPVTQFQQRVSREGIVKVGQMARIHLPDCSLMGIAGIWDEWRSPDRQTVIRSCAVITVEPNADVAQIHDRMPAILKREDYDTWLDPEVRAPNALLPLLKPWEGALLIELPQSRQTIRNTETSGDLFADEPG